MYKQASIIAVALFAASGAFASEVADAEAFSAAFTGTLTRAEVKADLLAARKAGQLGQSEYQANQMPTIKAERTRSELRAESIEAARAHPIYELY